MLERRDVSVPTDHFVVNDTGTEAQYSPGASVAHKLARK